MDGLHRAKGDERIRALLAVHRDDEFQVAGLVAAQTPDRSDHRA